MNNEISNMNKEAGPLFFGQIRYILFNSKHDFQLNVQSSNKELLFSGSAKEMVDNSLDSEIVSDIKLVPTESSTSSTFIITLMSDREREETLVYYSK